MYAIGPACWARGIGKIDLFVVEALFTTVTNVNFDEDRLVSLLARAETVRNGPAISTKRPAARRAKRAEALGGPASFAFAAAKEALIDQGGKVTPRGGPKDTVTSSRAFTTLSLSLKGSAAYADHAQVWGRRTTPSYAFCHEFLDFLSRDALSVDDLVAGLEAGKWNIRVMELLDAANTGNYGHPVPRPSA